MAQRPLGDHSKRSTQWTDRPDVAVLPIGEVILSKGRSAELPRKNQQLVISWPHPRDAGTAYWIGEKEEGFDGSLKVLTHGAVLLVSTYREGYRREDRFWKHWNTPPDINTWEVSGEDVLWAKGRAGELWCSLNGDAWEQLQLEFPMFETPPTINDAWRGSTTTLYVVVSGGQSRVTRVFKFRNMTQCRAGDHAP